MKTTLMALMIACGVAVSEAQAWYPPCPQPPPPPACWAPQPVYHAPPPPPWAYYPPPPPRVVVYPRWVVPEFRWVISPAPFISLVVRP